MSKSGLPGREPAGEDGIARGADTAGLPIDEVGTLATPDHIGTFRFTQSWHLMHIGDAQWGLG